MPSPLQWAPSAYRMLNGVLCVYKPVGMAIDHMVHVLQQNLCKGLNALPCYKYEVPLTQTKVGENLDVYALSVQTHPQALQDWSEHRLVLGDRYEEDDFNIKVVDEISDHSSGLVVLGLGSFGEESLSMIALARFLRVYHVKGRLGWATDDFLPEGKIVVRTSFGHVNRSKLDRLCATTQDTYSRRMYRLHGIHPASQEAYELAAAGIVRPADRGTGPVLYGIKCIHFQPPDFTLEIHSINESCLFLRQLINDMAVKLKTTAICTGIRRLRYGTFNLDRALVRQQWHLSPIIDNISANMALLEPDRLFVGAEAQSVSLPPPSSHPLLNSCQQHPSQDMGLADGILMDANSHIDKTSIGVRSHTDGTVVGTNSHMAETVVGTNSHTGETVVGTNSHTHETFVGTNSHTHETVVGTNSHTGEKVVGTNSHTNETVVDKNKPKYSNK